MTVIIVADIFGLTPELLAFSQSFNEYCIIDPYKGEMMAFNNEAEAYSYFTDNVGLDNYVRILVDVIKSYTSDIVLIGFSVGATAIWKLSENANYTNIKQAFCFYGSQIRYFTTIEPCFKLNMILPMQEDHFDVEALQNTLNNKRYVYTEKTEYLHGFMNRHSKNYNEIGYQAYVKLLHAQIH